MKRGKKKGNGRGKTITARTAALAGWVTKKFGKRPTTKQTSAVLAKMASEDLGYLVTGNRMARELYRQNVDFRKTPSDPAAPNYSKVELLRARLVYNEERLAEIERHLFGKNTDAFTEPPPP